MPRKTLVYIFGPDGAGKSTLAHELAQVWPNSLSFNASKPRGWPDTSWHEETAASSMDPTSLNPDYYLQTVGRCYRLAGEILRQSHINPVIIDSDIRSKIAVKASAWYGHDSSPAEIYSRLGDIANANAGSDIHQIGLYATLGHGGPDERAAELLRRIASRSDEASFFDPDSLDAARSLIIGFDGLETVIKQRGDPYLKVETDSPIDITQISSQLLPDR